MPCFVESMTAILVCLQTDCYASWLRLPGADTPWQPECSDFYQHTVCLTLVGPSVQHPLMLLGSVTEAEVILKLLLANLCR